MSPAPRFAFFGTPEIATIALNEMESFHCLPALVVTNPDAPVGRKQLLTPPPVKVWAEARGIPVHQPTTLKDPATLPFLTEVTWDFFVVFAYGKLLPEWLINLPKHGTINAHPSLLPKLRGASPIRSALLHDLSAIGVTIIQMDAGMDHGPILFQQPVPLEEAIPGRKLDTTLARICGDLLVHVMDGVMKNAITPREQNHEAATYTTKITKDMALLSLDPYNLPTGAAAQALYRQICAFDGWPTAFFIHDGKRVKITEAFLEKDGRLRISRIIPEGKKETDWSVYFPSPRP